MLIRTLRREDHLEWSFLALGVISLVTLVAFLNMYRSAASEADLNSRLLVELRLYQWLNLGFMIFAGLLFFSFSAVEAQVAASETLDVAFSATTLGLVLVFFIRGSFAWTRAIEIAKRDAPASGAAGVESTFRRRGSA